MMLGTLMVDNHESSLLLSSDERNERKVGAVKITKAKYIGMIAVMILMSLAIAALVVGIVYLKTSSETALSNEENDLDSFEDQDPTSKFDSIIAKKITSEFIYKYLAGFQTAAAAGGGGRASGTIGYNASLDYVMGVLQSLPTITARYQPWNTTSYTGVNIVADTIQGDPHNTIVVGAHLDAIQSGINDDASGCTTVLSLAVAVNTLIKNNQIVLKNRIRFMWYDKEERGMVGSGAAVQIAKSSSEPGESLSDLVAMLNADMLGSINFVIGILDGRNLPASAGASARSGSTILTQMFMDQMQLYNYSYSMITGSAYIQGSDQWSYWKAGIPAAILYSGVSEVHTAQDVKNFGGVLGIKSDPCYHLACDTILNVNVIILSRLTKLYGNVLHTLVVDDDIRNSLNFTSPSFSLEGSAEITNIQEFW